MVHSNRDFVHLCLSLLEKLRDDNLRIAVIEEVIRVLVKPIQGTMTVDAYSRHLFYKVLGEMYSAGMKAGHEAIGLHGILPTTTTTAIGKQGATVKPGKLNAEQKFALEVAPFIKVLRKTGYESINQIADKLNELDRPSPNENKWDAQLVEKIEELIYQIENM